jgi:hypothetical protein
VLFPKAISKLEVRAPVQLPAKGIVPEVVEFPSITCEGPFNAQGPPAEFPAATKIFPGEVAKVFEGLPVLIC